MSDQGGRAAQKLWAALALFLFLLPILPVAPAQSLSDPWWGPADRTKPTDGFAVRIPVIVENRNDYPMRDPFVAVEIDFAKLLVEAGWTNQTVGTETRLRGFTLDVDSIRVVPYNRGFVTGPVSGSAQQPIPHVFYPALLETPKFREFDAARNPSGTVMFQIPTDFQSLQPQEKRYFYIYANPLEFGKTPAPEFDLLDKSPLDAFLWGTTGNVYYGFEPQQLGQDHTLLVASTVNKPTVVTVYSYELGRYTPMASTSAYPNPVTLQAFQTAELYVPAGRAFKVEGEHPIILTGTGAPLTNGNTEAAGYIPGRSGSFADNAFTFQTPFTGVNGRVFVNIVKASPGSVTVTSTGGGSVTLNAAKPVDRIQVNDLLSGWTSLNGNGKFLVSFDSPQSAVQQKPYIGRQVPAMTGGPSGKDFFTHIETTAGRLSYCADTNVSVRTVDHSGGGTLQIAPEGTLPNVEPLILAKSLFCQDIDVPRAAPPNSVYEFYSVTPDSGKTKPGDFRILSSAGERHPDATTNHTRPFIGHYGGLAGVDYYLYGDVGLFGHYNDTRITIFEERTKNGETYVTNRTRALQRDEFLPIPRSADSTARFHVISTKPIAAASMAPASYVQFDTRGEPITFNIPYWRSIPGRPIMPTITIGDAEFRGPLVEIRSPETDARQIFRSTGPGSPLTFRLDVMNLGRWIGGEGLPDTITIGCTLPDGWTIDGCAKEVTLGTGSAERLSVVVTPSDDAIVDKTYPIEVTARSKTGAASASYKLLVYVEVRYGVGLWFDVEGGRKTIDPPIGLNPAETYRYSIVIKNTGSTIDTFDLKIEDAREGWEHELLFEGEPVTDMRLPGGESAILHYRVKAPNAEQAFPNIVSITAQSTANALAADVLNAATRIRPKVDVELTLEPQTRLAEPNESVVFNLSTRNKGNDVFTIILRQDSILPKGWEAKLDYEEISLNPNTTALIPLTVTPPTGARAGDLASVKISAEVDTGGAGGRVAGDEVSAVVVVRRVFNLTSPPISDAEALPGQTLSFVLPIRNEGNGQVAIELLSGAVEAALLQENGDALVVPDWEVALETDGVTLGLNETADLPIRIRVPAGAPPGAYDLTFTTRLSREALQNLTIPVDVKRLARVDFDGPVDISLTPGRAHSVGYIARNSGNVEGSFDLRAAAPVGWNATFAPPRARLAPGEQVNVLLTLNATRDAANGDNPIRLEAQAEGTAIMPTPVNVRVARPQLYLADVDATGDLRTGELVLVTATVGNRGGIEATNVSLALVVDGRTVDRIILSRIPVGSSALATMSWVATQRGGSVSVVLDPDQEIALAARDETVADVEFGSVLGVPGPGIALLLASIIVVAFASAPTLTTETRSARRKDDSSHAPWAPWLRGKADGKRKERDD